jgi:hypothetical protein
MPSDLLSAAQQHRADLAAEMTSDLAISDPKVVDTFITDGLIADLQKIAAMKPAVYYFPATRQQIANLMAAGWSDPRFQYLRFAGDFSYTQEFRLSAAAPMDDLIWWVETHDGDTDPTRHDALVAQIKALEAGLADNISMFSKNQTEHIFESFIHETVFAPLKLPARLQWIDFGAANIFAVKYCAVITGMSRGYWTEQLIGRPDESRPFLYMDLINGPDPSQIRPELLPAYDEAILPKGALAVQTLLTKSGDGALAKVLPAWRTHPPQTPQQLIQSIQSATGVDLTPVMQPDYSLPGTRPTP